MSDQLERDMEAALFAEKDPDFGLTVRNATAVAVQVAMEHIATERKKLALALLSSEEGRKVITAAFRQVTETFQAFSIALQKWAEDPQIREALGLLADEIRESK